MKNIDINLIRKLVEQVLEERNQIEFQPELVPTSKDRIYHRATLTIDVELWQRLQDECKRLHILPPRLIDTLLWQYFKKPPLSFEIEKMAQPQKPNNPLKQGPS